MDFGLDLSSRLEDRIEKDLLSDSDDLSLPGTGRRASVLGQSFDDQSQFASSFQEEDREPAHSHPREQTRVLPDTGHDSLAVDLQDLDGRLLDDSHSLELSTQHAPNEEDASQFSMSADTPSRTLDKSSDSQFMQEHGNFSLRAAQVHASDEEDSSSASDDSVLESPTSHTASASPTVIQKRRGSMSRSEASIASHTTPPDSPSGHPVFSAAKPIEAHDSGAQGTVPAADSHPAARRDSPEPLPAPPPAGEPGRSAPSPAPAAPEPETRASQSPSLPAGSLDASVSADASERRRATAAAAAPEPVEVSHQTRSGHGSGDSHGSLSSSGSTSLSDILTVPNVHANTSMPQFHEDTGLLGSHVDPHRLILYQDKLNRQLAEENEALKMQCDVYLQILQAHGLVPSEEDGGVETGNDASASQSASVLRDASSSRGASVSHRPSMSNESSAPHGASVSKGAPAPTPPVLQPSPAEAHLKRRIRDLEAIVDEQHRRLHSAPPVSAAPPPPPPPVPAANAAETDVDWDVLERTRTALQDRHEAVLEEAEDALASDGDLRTTVAQLRAALNQAHGVINAMHAAHAQSPPSLRASLSNAPNVSVSMDADEALEELGPLHTKARRLTDELAEARAALDDALADARDANLRRVRLEERLVASQADLEAAQARLDEKAASLHALRSAPASPRDTPAVREAMAQVEAATAQRLHMEQQQHILEEQLARITQQAKDTQLAADHARGTRHALEAQLDAHIEQIEALQHALALRTDEIAQLRGEKDHLWNERQSIMDQVHRFELHLREVRADTERYGAELAALQREKHSEQDAAAEAHDAALDAAERRARRLRSELRAVSERCEVLVSQKAYVTSSLRAHEWLFRQLSTHLKALAPLLRRYGGVPPPRRRPTLRGAVWAVRAALRLGM
ncbi:hypothetical protein MBRA1_002595 [Malassezia brasiliensis]|uniref:Pericentrin/AKAP-450 centrosomal targeting domain-containing protein n=1 Tax=Malassezia brasiliensis TaxID=1821822 RepID=A0AAF0IP81_9BASI|nr:hypothetical protein MBRA1_002595 [Malassezia brasiliensis]